VLSNLEIPRFEPPHDPLRIVLPLYLPQSLSVLGGDPAEDVLVPRRGVLVEEWVPEAALLAKSYRAGDDIVAYL
jgi:hypothetical protein